MRLRLVDAERAENFFEEDLLQYEARRVEVVEVYRAKVQEKDAKRQKEKEEKDKQREKSKPSNAADKDPGIGLAEKTVQDVAKLLKQMAAQIADLKSENQRLHAEAAKGQGGDLRNSLFPALRRSNVV